MRLDTHGHHWNFTSLRLYVSNFGDQLKAMWLGILFIVLGALALISAVILAYPVVAYIAAKFFQ